MPKRTHLIAARKSKGLSAEKLAQLLGVSKAMISHYENCRHDPSAEVIIRLEKFFGIPAGELLAVSRDEPEPGGE
ncbi:helix-turn-helix domain protein [Desulfofundulus kuznetsovii DSM 6115]|jgi:putative transcriptional regulator|uniref:Helix-turn-helix domain protein n=1 Tax=Desulfofundulus kuznetsovii (strain DSM 6115 / VKM B-1805 / 17) TaxID=760568 RepID=A0AAU8PCV0_DESK7|nr:helix-turn-helix domain protein [Desulfofundulus kuznetsovii DSM 6115]